MLLHFFASQYCNLFHPLYCITTHELKNKNTTRVIAIFMLQLIL